MGVIEVVEVEVDASIVAYLNADETPADVCPLLPVFPPSVNVNDPLLKLNGSPSAPS